MSLPTPPVAKRVTAETVLHGETRKDDYAWLRDKVDPEVVAYLEAENAYTDAVMKPTETLQKQLYDEMLARIREDDSRPPVKHDDWFYYVRTEQGKAYPIYCRKHKSLDAPEEIFFDQNEAAREFEYYQLGGLEVSPDHRHLALLVDTSGYEAFTLRVLDLATREYLADEVESVSFGLAWASDNRTVFYVTTDAAKRGNEVWRHTLGTSRDRDASVYRDDDQLYNVGVGRSRDGKWIYLVSGSFTSGEASLLDAHVPTSEPRVVRRRGANVEYDVAAGGEWLYVLTNLDGAKNFKVMRAPVSDPGEWVEWLPHRDDVFVENVDVFRSHVVVLERHDGLRRVRVIMLTGDQSGAPDVDSHFVEFPEAAYGVSLGSNPEFGTPVLRFTYSSLVTPDSVYDYDVVTRERTLLKREEVVGGYEPSQYAVERIMVPARDGAMVPVSLVYRTPLEHDAKRPLVLYAYGSYGYTMEPTFGSTRLSLLDRGFVYAIAHIRGGQEMGRAWYDDGKMMKKMNTFFDFIDCAEYLVAAKYTSKERIVAHGGSAGGLLMGAIANLRPELFHAVVADVPFVDVINTMLDESIPLTAQEWEQWGNPKIAEHYAYMRSYSPYDNVEAKAYPRMLITSGINDPRVAFWEPAKWIAKLRAVRTDSNTLLLKMQMGAGHGGPSGRYERLKEQAFRYAFMLTEGAA
ncbi:MAG: S9 family peptidase [Gemmatimonadetes bacterium]|nr:S9 family peptidase [Gemmatimonadota bacterium]